MAKLLNEIKHDLHFMQSHTLQPKWYKILKVFILLGFLGGYWILFGLGKMVLFVAVFMFLGLLLHFLYRVKTERWRKSWRDFVVTEVDGEVRQQRIGAFYYGAILLNTALAVAISQILL